METYKNFFVFIIVSYLIINCVVYLQWEKLLLPAFEKTNETSVKDTRDTLNESSQTDASSDAIRKKYMQSRGDIEINIGFKSAVGRMFGEIAQMKNYLKNTRHFLTFQLIALAALAIFPFLRSYKKTG